MVDASLASSIEAEFARRLASNEKKIRDRAIKKLRQFLNIRSMKSDGGFTRDEMLRIWKGLFYCMWMSDKPLIQEELAKAISGLMLGVTNIKTAMLFFETSFTTVEREWKGIDRLRMDKFYLLVRFMLQRGLEFLKSQKWKSSLEDWLLAILKNGPINANGPAFGLHYHLADIYLEELSKVGQECLTQEQVMKFVDPFCIVLAKSRNLDFVKSVRENIFQELVETSDVALDLLRKEELEFTNAGDHTKPPNVESALTLKIDYKAVADRLFSLVSEKDVCARNRKQVHVVVKQFRELAEGRLPLDTIPDIAGSDEDQSDPEEKLVERLVLEKTREIRKKHKRERGKKRKKELLRAARKQAVQDDQPDGELDAEEIKEKDGNTELVNGEYEMSNNCQDDGDESQKKTTTSKTKKKKKRKTESCAIAAETESNENKNTINKKESENLSGDCQDDGDESQKKTTTSKPKKKKKLKTESCAIAAETESNDNLNTINKKESDNLAGDSQENGDESQKKMMKAKTKRKKKRKTESCAIAAKTESIENHNTASEAKLENFSGGCNGYCDNTMKKAAKDEKSTTDDSVIQGSAIGDFQNLEDESLSEAEATLLELPPRNTDARTKSKASVKNIPDILQDVADSENVRKSKKKKKNAAELEETWKLLEGWLKTEKMDVPEDDDFAEPGPDLKQSLKKSKRPHKGSSSEHSSIDEISKIVTNVGTEKKSKSKKTSVDDDVPKLARIKSVTPRPITSTFFKTAANKVEKIARNKHLAAVKRRNGDPVSDHSPKRVFFEMSKTQVKPFRKTDKAIAVSPSPAQAAFDPRRRPDFGLLKSGKRKGVGK